MDSPRWIGKLEQIFWMLTCNRKMGTSRELWLRIVNYLFFQSVGKLKMIEIWKFFNPSLIFFQTIREKVARYNYSSLQIHQPTMEYYIYELFIRLTWCRVTPSGKKMKLLSQVLLNMISSPNFPLLFATWTGKWNERFNSYEKLKRGTTRNERNADSVYQHFN